MSAPRDSRRNHQMSCSMYLSEDGSVCNQSIYKKKQRTSGGRWKLRLLHTVVVVGSLITCVDATTACSTLETADHNCCFWRLGWKRLPMPTRPNLTDWGRTPPPAAHIDSIKPKHTTCWCHWLNCCKGMSSDYTVFKLVRKTINNRTTATERIIFSTNDLETVLIYFDLLTAWWQSRTLYIYTAKRRMQNLCMVV